VAIQVGFRGPYSWPGTTNAPSIFSAPIGQSCGLYVWSIRVGEQEIIYYVGITTRRFRDRFREHLGEHTSGGYHLYDPEAFTRGIKKQLWPGRFGSIGRSSQEFMENFEQFAPAIAALARLYRFHVAPLAPDGRTLERVEAALANYLYDSPGIVGDFQDRGIHYRPRWPSEVPFEVAFTSVCPLLGLPAALSA
jgi:hypothetical protein